MAGAATQILRPVLHAAGAMLLAVALVLVAGTPAQAVTRYEITSPSETVTGPTTITAEVDADRIERIERVELRLLRGDAPYGPTRSLTHTDGSREPGQTSSWETPLDPMRSWAAIPDGAPMHNGLYRFEIRVHSTGPFGSPRETAWAGRDVVIDVKPPAPSVTARVVSQTARSIEVAWDASTVPDFKRYVVQRAAGGSFTDVATLTTASTTRFVDAVAEPGTYRYRVAVVREAGTGGDSTTTSQERAATVSEPGDLPDEGDTGEVGPGGPSAPPRPGDEGTPPPGDGDRGGEGSGDGGGDGQPDQGGEDDGATTSFGRRSGSGAPPTSGNATVPAVGTTGGAPSTPRPQIDGQVDDTFAETLPYDLDLEREVTERRTEVRPGEVVEGGTLSVYNRELALEEILPPLAGGLLFFVIGGHVLRLRRE